MANYQNYGTNGLNNGDSSQFNTDIDPNSVVMLNHLFQNGFNQANKAHMVNNNGNNLVYALPTTNFNFAQPIQNTFHPQYANGVNNGLLQMANNNNLGVYINNAPHFINGDAYANGMSQFVPMQNFAQGMVQIDVPNAINKNGQRLMQSRKRSYVDQTKPLDPGEMEYDHKNRPLIYNCKECPRKFSMNSRLNTHMRCHNGERPHICLTCNFAFTQKSYLVRHAAVHKEERPYQCHACKKTYKHYGSLANHRKTHKNGRNDMNELEVEEIADHQKIETESIVNDFQNHEYIFAEQLKQEPQPGSIAADLSMQYQPSDQVISYVEELNQYSQNGIFFNSTDTSDLTENTQPSSNPAPTFTS